MLLLQKLAFVVLVSLTAVWAQSGPGSTSSATATAEQAKYTLEPVAISNALYPLQAREQKAEGEVVAAILISEAGEIRNVRVFKGDPLLVKSVEDAVNKWKFNPIMKGDRAIRVITTAKFRFVLSDDKQGGDGVTPELGPATELPQRVRVSSGVIAGLLMRKVQPVYPSDARRAGVQGTVMMEGVISKDGKVTDLHVISGPPELTAAAVEAVKQWRYGSYLFMGDPMEVDTQFQVNFTLSH